MSSKKLLSRREFMEKGALGTAGFAVASHMTAPAILKAQSANDTIGIGVIGFGIRARQMMCVLGHAHPKAAPNATGFGTISREDRTRGYGRKTKPLQPFSKEKVRAVCDVYQDALTYAGELFDGSVKMYDNYRKVLEDPDIDAILIFTPDHWHEQIAIDASEAGKDVFIEKCPTHSIKESVALKRAIEKNNTVLQLNESGVHSPAAQKMRELVRSGALGHVSMVRSYKYIPIVRRLWDWPIPSDLSPQTIDWKEWLGPAPDRVFDPKRIIQWRCFWDYGTGVCGDLFSHMLATINLVMEIHIPKTAVASGGVYDLKDYFEVPTVYNSVYEYPDKDLTVIFSANFASTFSPSSIEYIGSDASMTNSRDEILLFAEPLSEKYTRIYGEGKIEAGKPTEIIKVAQTMEMPSTEYHFHEFFDCIRTRKKPSCDMHMCFSEDISCHMGTEAFLKGRKMTWNEKTLTAE